MSGFFFLSFGTPIQDNRTTENLLVFFNSLIQNIFASKSNAKPSFLPTTIFDSTVGISEQILKTVKVCLLVMPLHLTPHKISPHPVN